MSVVGQFLHATEVDNSKNGCKRRQVYFVE